MRWWLIILCIGLVFVVACQGQTYVIQTQIPGNNTLLVEHECGAGFCGNFIDTQETQP